MARVTRLVAIGYFCTNSRRPASMQQKYCDPRAVDGAVEDHMTDSMGMQFLRLGRQPQEPIELSVDEELHRLHRRADNPIDVFAWINADMRDDRRQEHMLGRAQRGDPNSLTPQVGDAADVL